MGQPLCRFKGECIMTMHTTGLTQEQINTLMKGIPTYYNIDINTFEGMIDGDLVVYEKGGNPNDGFVLYGFDEVGMFDDEFTNPQYCMMKDNA